jgi:rod shape-determining protein MreD
MFREIILWLIIFLAVIFQISVFPNFFPSGTSPEIILILVIFWSTRDGFKKNWKKAIAAGLILDLFYFQPVGTNVITLVLAAYAAGFISRRFLILQKTSGFFIILAIIAGGTFFNNLIMEILLKIRVVQEVLKIGVFAPKIWNITIFMRIAVNLFSFAIIYWPLSNLEKFLSFYKKRSMQGRFFR